MKGFRITEEQLKAIQARSTVRTHHMEGHVDRRSKSSKYNNCRFTDSEGSWDSKRERERWGQLRLLESSGRIQQLRKKVVYELIASSFKNHKRLRPIQYVADFVYIEQGIMVVEDSKGFRNKVYELKKRLMWEKYGIDIFET